MYRSAMATITKTLKLQFLSLNKAKADELAMMQAENTMLANRILAMPKSKRRGLTTAHFKDLRIGSVWINQTIRDVNKAKNTKKFRAMPLHVSGSLWTLHKHGDTYSVAFPSIKEVKRRIPLDVHPGGHKQWLGSVMRGKAEPKDMKIVCSKKGIWSVILVVSKEVPDAAESSEWIGVDRGLKIPAVAAMPNNGRVFFFKSGRLKNLRKRDDRRRLSLINAGKQRELKKLSEYTSRAATHINHVISKQLVGLASRSGVGLQFEDLSNMKLCIAGLVKKRKRSKDSSMDLRWWSYDQLEKFCSYKAALKNVPVSFVPAPYTSKTHHRCGRLGHRKSSNLHCPHCQMNEHADLNASRVIGGYRGLFCAVGPSKGDVVMASSGLPSGLTGAALNPVREVDPQGSA